MSIEFNADEIFELAEQMERNGSRFYRRAAAAVKDPRVHELLLHLAQMEVDHEETFGAMRAELTEGDRVATVYDPEGEATQYLRAMVSGHVFDLRSDPSTQLTGKESLEQVYHSAIAAEKNSVVYYLGLKEIVPERLGKDRVDSIIKEEMGHITLLSGELSALRK